MCVHEVLKSKCNMLVSLRHRLKIIQWKRHYTSKDTIRKISAYICVLVVVIENGQDK